MRDPEVVILELTEGDGRFDAVLGLASSVLGQDRYLRRDCPHAEGSHVLGAFRGERCVGFLRFLVQRIGADVGRPPIVGRAGPLTEGYVEAFGVDPAERRTGIGTMLQAHAIEHCRAAGCFQMRSRSPVTSIENYQLKLAAGYAVSPSEENDSYYFVLRLP